MYRSKVLTGPVEALIGITAKNWFISKSVSFCTGLETLYTFAHFLGNSCALLGNEPKFPNLGNFLFMVSLQESAQLGNRLCFCCGYSLIISLFSHDDATNYYYYQRQLKMSQYREVGFRITYASELATPTSRRSKHLGVLPVSFWNTSRTIIDHLSHDTGCD